MATSFQAPFPVEQTQFVPKRGGAHKTVPKRLFSSGVRASKQAQANLLHVY